MKKHDHKGLEAMTGKPKDDKKESKAEHKKPAVKHPSGLKLRELRTRELHDGTFHHTHIYEDAKGVPHPHSTEASSATPEDAGSYTTEQFGGAAPQAAMSQGQDAGAGEAQSPELNAAMPPQGGQ